MVTFSEARLGYGGGAAGLLGAGFGVGAVFGAVAAAGLIGRSHLLPYLVASALLTRSRTSPSSGSMRSSPPS